MLEQLSELLKGANEEVVPKVRELLGPLLASLPRAPNLDPVSLLGLAAMTVQRSTFEASVSTTLGNLDFINIGKWTISFFSYLRFFSDLCPRMSCD